MKCIAIYGCGGFGREVKSLIDQINSYSKKFEFIGYFDDGISKDTLIGNDRVLGGIKDLNMYPNEILLVISIADPKIKNKIVDSISNNNISFPVLIHPSSIISDIDVVIGEGSIICAAVIITVNVNIGKHVILNLGCTVGHDTTIGEFSSFMPAVNISGEVNIGSHVYCGTGAKIVNQINIGENTSIGAGSLVHKSLPPNCVAIGFPAKPIKL